jgi:aryl-alcohol dehydrogenase-like predicted oxidoreductase
VDGGIRALDLLDCAMVAYNPGYTNEEPVLAYAAKTGKGILVKKALASGHLDPAQNPLQSVLDHPGVTSAIVGTINPQHLRMNVQNAEF